MARAARVLLGSRVPQRRPLVIQRYFPGRDLTPPPHSRPRPTVMAGHPGSLWCRPASSFLRRYRRYLASMRRVDRFGSSSRMWHRTRPISTGSFPRLFIPSGSPSRRTKTNPSAQPHPQVNYYYFFVDFNFFNVKMYY